MRAPQRRWSSFVLWAFAGATATLGATQLAFFAVPVSLLLIFGLVRDHAGWPMLGSLAGAGGAMAVIGGMHLNSHPCDDGRILVDHGSRTFSCGGYDGEPLLVIGAVVTLAACMVYVVSRRRSQ
jgi:hypothetical protein